MNLIRKSEEYCQFCLDPPFTSNETWYFNKIISLGIYKTYENEPYNRIPLNILTKIVLMTKGDVKKQKPKLGNYIADGLFQIVKQHPFLLNEKTILLIPPKYNRAEENQCIYFLIPFIKILKKNGYGINNISDKILRVKDVGKSRKKDREKRFTDIKNAHKLSNIDLKNQKILILDDVVTSCSTIWDISRELKEKNASEINILSIGRTLMSGSDILGDNISHDLEFNELITYFSNLDNILEPKKIDDVRLNDININDFLIECSLKNYDLRIDFENMTLKHNCRDFEIKRMMNKSFCKHITKLFYEIRREYGERFSREKLYYIYANLLNWKFDTN